MEDAWTIDCTKISYNTTSTNWRSTQARTLISIVTIVIMDVIRVQIQILVGSRKRNKIIIIAAFREMKMIWLWWGQSRRSRYNKPSQFAHLRTDYNGVKQCGVIKLLIVNTFQLTQCVISLLDQWKVVPAIGFNQKNHHFHSFSCLLLFAIPLQVPLPENFQFVATICNFKNW